VNLCQSEWNGNIPLQRVHLINLCRFIGVTPFGTDEFLRVRLRARLAAIKVRRTQCLVTAWFGCWLTWGGAEAGASERRVASGACRPMFRRGNW